MLLWPNWIGHSATNRSVGIRVPPGAPMNELKEMDFSVMSREDVLGLWTKPIQHFWAAKLHITYPYGCLRVEDEFELNIPFLVLRQDILVLGSDIPQGCLKVEDEKETGTFDSKEIFQVV